VADLTPTESLAEIAYMAGMDLRRDKYRRIEPWETLPEHSRRIYRAQVAAILKALEPTPEPVAVEPEQDDLFGGAA
jgi:hypothetical protein